MYNIERQITTANDVIKYVNIFVVFDTVDCDNRYNSQYPHSGVNPLPLGLNTVADLQK